MKKPKIIILIPLITARQLEATGLPKSSALGLFGIPGLTAYLGLMEIGKPKVDWWVICVDYSPIPLRTYSSPRLARPSLSAQLPARWVTLLDKLQSKTNTKTNTGWFLPVLSLFSTKMKTRPTSQPEALLDEEFHGRAVLVGSIRILLLTEFLLLQEFWVFGSLVTLVMATRPLGSRLNW